MKFMLLRLTHCERIVLYHQALPLPTGTEIPNGSFGRPINVGENNDVMFVESSSLERHLLRADNMTFEEAPNQPVVTVPTVSGGPWAGNTYTFVTAPVGRQFFPLCET